MTHRERFITTLTFGRPDRVPFQPGVPRESTLAAWHAQGLPKHDGWFQHLVDRLGLPWRPPATPPPDLGVDFRMIPQFEEKILEHTGEHYIVQDWKGNICEISDRYDPSYLREAKDFVTRRWIRCPVENEDDWEKMRSRYDPDDPRRFPTDFQERCRVAAKRDDILTVTVSGPFWQMREWCGFERLCLLMTDDPILVKRMAAFWEEFVVCLLERIFAELTFDRLLINEDMAFKGRSMISPDMTRRFCKPCWTRWSTLAKEAGVPIVEIDSDGYCGELIPIWIECGINACSPLEVAAGNDIAEFRRRFGRKMAFRQGVDKRALARGGEIMREE
ncbi:MAG: hypothetical protein N2255_03170, partial [Kiritimatiellae bacterium]|nr:hypothetical protein [Kiritimatiellia bacterium]